MVACRFGARSAVNLHLWERWGRGVSFPAGLRFPCVNYLAIKKRAPSPASNSGILGWEGGAGAGRMCAFGLALLFLLLQMGCAGGARAEASSARDEAPARMMEFPAGMAAAQAPDMNFGAAMDAPEGDGYSFQGGSAEQVRPSASNAKVGAESATPPSPGEVGSGTELPLGAGDPAAEDASGEARRPLLIYHAELGLGVFRVQENLDKIEKMALDAGGYLVTRSEQSITVRVPVKGFEPTVDAVLKLGDVHRRQIVAQDVTAEFFDLQIRLKNALAVRERLHELLQKAQDVKEALKVEEELGRVAEQIELMKGRLKYLREVTSFSTIGVEFSERSAPIEARVQLPFGWLRELGLNSLLRL